MNSLSYRSNKTCVKRSPIQGMGLFANELIGKDEIVCIKGGYIHQQPAWEELEKELGAAEIQIDDDFFIAPSNALEREGSMLYTNHSCDPNIGIQGQIVFVAMRDINAGEELTHDWATTDHDDYQMECRCGSPECRKRITGQDWQNQTLQEKYQGYFSWYLCRKIAAKKGAGYP